MTRQTGEVYVFANRENVEMSWNLLQKIIDLKIEASTAEVLGCRVCPGKENLWLYKIS